MPNFRPLPMVDVAARLARTSMLAWLLLAVGSTVAEAQLATPGSGLATRPEWMPGAATTASGATSGKTPIARRAPSEASGAETPHGSSLWSTYAVLGGLVLFVVIGSRWIKRAAPRRFGGLPAAAVDVLGVRSLTPQHTLHIVRVGERVLVLGAGSDGVRTLAEVNDPAEAEQLVSLCGRGEAANSAVSARFSEPASAAPESPRSPGMKHPSDGGWRSLLRAGVLLIAAGSMNIAAAQQRGFGFDAPRSDYRSTVVAGREQAMPPREGDPRMPGAPRGIQLASHEETTFAPAAVVTAATESSLTSWLNPSDLSSTLKFAVLAGVMSLAPGILIMTTCYVRIVVVLGLLRQAIGVVQFPPTQVLTSLSLFLTAIVMWPIWEKAYHAGIEPYARGSYATDAERATAAQTAIDRTLQPVRRFMSGQIEATGNEAAIDLLLDYQADAQGTTAPTTAAYYEDVPTRVLLPAYLLSELKTAFLLGFQIYLPFVVLDLVVSSVLSGLGLVMLSPTLVSLPLKLLLFVLIDGWSLTIQMLLKSIAAA